MPGETTGTPRTGAAYMDDKQNIERARIAQGGACTPGEWHELCEEGTQPEETATQPEERQAQPEETATQPEEVARSLRACAATNMECRHCHHDFGIGCARDLKLEAAAMLEKMAKTTRGGAEHD